MPCAHCGINFMFHNLDKEASRLCNNCVVREDLRTNKKEMNMKKNINILISCPEEIQREIEELCMKKGVDYSVYFLELHENRDLIEKAKLNRLEHSEKGGDWQEEDIEISLPKKKGIKK